MAKNENLIESLKQFNRAGGGGGPPNYQIKSHSFSSRPASVPKRVAMGGVGGHSRRPASIDSSQNMADKETRNDEMGSMMASSMED